MKKKFRLVVGFAFAIGLLSTSMVLGEEAISSELAKVLSGVREHVDSESVPAGVSQIPVVGAEQASGKIIIFEPNSDWNDPASIRWAWSPSDSPQIRPEHYGWFGHPDECKPACGTSCLLATASGGGVVLVRLEDKATLFYAYAGGNPHSAALLPDGNIVSISSAGFFTVYAVPEGDFRAESVKSRKYPIVGGHGIEWDARSNCLWALGYEELAAYRYNFDKENPEFTKEYSLPLKGTPAHYGHDFYPVPGAHAFFLTGVGVAIFDVPTRTLVSISNAENIKSISLSPDGRLIVLSPTKQWWSPTIKHLNRSLTPFAQREGAKFYKARWWISSAPKEE
ncbi:MAG: DUF6528 family protein [Planctomycetia bacterium]|nr:DUF6528 family protein [Planctomycetia bacterium]